MKLSALLLLAAAASACVAQNVIPFQKAVPSPDQNPNIGIVDDDALSRAVTAVAAEAEKKELQKMMDRVNQANCPVVLTGAGLTPYVMLLNTSSDVGSDSANRPGLELEFRNVSGREIRSMEFSARILVKRSIYDLDYLPAIHLYLTAYGTRSVDATFAQLRHLSLPQGIRPSLVEGITLEQVTFGDGSVWTPKNDDYCAFNPNQMLSVAR
jgi:hypothetical protein